MVRAWATKTNQAFHDMLADNWSHNQTDYDTSSDTDGAELVERLFQASVDVETETGAPAQFVIASTAMFVSLAAKSRIVPAYAGNMANAAGNQLANTLQVSVNGLPVIHDRDLPGTELIVSNTLAAKWAEDGPYTITADDVAKLGQNVAVWGLGAPMILRGDGIVRIYND
jgi:hypothetical protein